MADVSLCASDGCAVSKLCRRHSDCPVQYPADLLRQSYSAFEPEKGEACRGFLAHSAYWREMAQ